MSSLKDFKNSADEIMRDITVSQELKHKTLMRIKKRKSNFIKTALVPAACIMILLVSVSIWKLGTATTQPNKGINDIQNANIMNATENNTLPASPGKDITNNSKATVSGSLNSLEEAKKYIGNIPIVPSYLPDGAKLINIQGVSYNNENRKSIWIQYSLEDNTFVVSIEQKGQWESFEGYKDVEVNGLKGHMKSYKDASYESSELRWFSDKNLYTVEGGIPIEETLKIARSLK